MTTFNINYYNNKNEYVYTITKGIPSIEDAKKKLAELGMYSKKGKIPSKLSDDGMRHDCGGYWTEAEPEEDEKRPVRIWQESSSTRIEPQIAQ